MPEVPLKTAMLPKVSVSLPLDSFELHHTSLCGSRRKMYVSLLKFVRSPKLLCYR